MLSRARRFLSCMLDLSEPHPDAPRRDRTRDLGHGVAGMFHRMLRPFCAFAGIEAADA